MKRLSEILLVIGTILIVTIALLMIGLSFMLPALNHYRPQLLAKIASLSGVSLQVSFIQGGWQPYGPRLEMYNINATLPTGNLHIERLTLSLNVWRSLLYWSWKFRDITIHQLQCNLHVTVDDKNSQGHFITYRYISDVMLNKFDYFNLYNSYFSFFTTDEERITLKTPHFTWLNSHNHHQAKGKMTLSTPNGQNGMAQLLIDLHDNKQFLNIGTIYFQADNLNVQPWFTHYLHVPTKVKNTDFSLATWLHIQNSTVVSGYTILKRGTVNCYIGKKQHKLDSENLILFMRHKGTNWEIKVPRLQLRTDGHAWPKGSLYALWLPKNHTLNQNDTLHIRVTNMQLERISLLLPTLPFFSPNLLEQWHDAQVHGTIINLSLDIPLQQLNKTHCQAIWKDVSWRPGKLRPGINHFSGVFRGRVTAGHITLSLNSSTLPYPNIFRTPLKINSAHGTLIWRYQDQGWELASENLAVKATSLRVNGNFYYYQPTHGNPWLNILAGIRLYNGGDVWRYLPEPMMGKKLVNYLSKALQGGEAKHATLICTGDPTYFPYYNNEGQFKVFIPLRHSTFRVQPGWPALTDLSVDLNFVNSGLWMQAAHAKLGEVIAKNISAVIPSYLKKQLLVDAELVGNSTKIYDFFKHTPMHHSLSVVLNELQLKGNLNGRVHLHIPLDHGKVQATGKVILHNNSLWVKRLGSELRQLSGEFYFDDSNLKSDTVSANWFGQPMVINFTTQENQRNYKINITVKGKCQPTKFVNFPKNMINHINGTMFLRSRIFILLPRKGRISYDISVNADLKKIRSSLPSPLEKSPEKTLLLKMKIVGGLNGFILSGGVEHHNYFNSEWLFEKHKVTLVRAVWKNTGYSIPDLPQSNSLTFNLPTLDVKKWLTLLAPKIKKNNNIIGLSIPNIVVIKIPQLLLGGQVWHKITLSAIQQNRGIQWIAKGDEIDGSLQMLHDKPWRINLIYLYYNPHLAKRKNSLKAMNSTPKIVSFDNWPTQRLRCQSCWLLGHNFGKVEANLSYKGNRLILKDGLIDTEHGKMIASGEWQQGIHSIHGKLTGKLVGSKIEQTADFLGINIPLQGGPYSVDYQIYWRGQPWHLKLSTIRGIIQFKIGKGKIDSISAGRTEQLLRLVSFDALWRKLQFDFSDTFSKSFYFDSIQSTILLKNGIMNTNNLLVDGLSADISMNGQIDLTHNRIKMEAVVAPEISSILGGVATAFVVNPIVGAIVFTTSKVLRPIWSTLFLMRYHISGDLGQIKINKISPISK
ncbi:AsmA2 domain-containing protein YhdP [Candidatus Gillettellia adelgis]